MSGWRQVFLQDLNCLPLKYAMLKVSNDEAMGIKSGDHECPLKDVIMPDEESRLKRDDPLTAILAQSAGLVVVSVTI
ncbi:hypothetical protein Ancab_033153 [Ancistrocladus abbreviatus]